MSNIIDTAKQFLETCDKTEDPKLLEKYLKGYILGIGDALHFANRYHSDETIQVIHSMVSTFMIDVYEQYGEEL